MRGVLLAWTVPFAAHAQERGDADALLRARLVEAEARLAEAEASLSARRARDAAVIAPSPNTPRLYANIWVQPQFILPFYNAAASPNAQGGQLADGVGANDATYRADGTTTNGAMFRMRRSRLRLVGELNEHMRAFAEIDVFPVGTGDIFLRNVVATGIARWRPDLITEFSAGSFKVPLTYELLEPSRDRPFLERSLTSVAFFPGDRDVGAWAQTKYKERLTVDVAVINGRTFGEANAGFLPDYNRGKDVVIHASYNSGPASVGLGAYAGSGTVPRGDASVHSYHRAALHAEAALHHSFWPKLGKSAAYVHATYGQNMDRGVRYAFALPGWSATAPGELETRHQFGGFLRLEQDLGRYVTLGARYELYTTNLKVKDNLAQQLGGLLSLNFTKGLALRFEYLHGRDRSHAEGQEAPNRVVHTLSTWMQARYD